MNEPQKRDLLLRMSGVEPRRCMRCGKCSATCPSYDEMEYHPHQFVYMVEKGELEKLLDSESIYKCLTCFACVERCPRGVEPARLIDALRTLSTRERGRNRLTPDMIPELIDDSIPSQALMSALRRYSK